MFLAALMTFLCPLLCCIPQGSALSPNKAEVSTDGDLAVLAYRRALYLYCSPFRWQIPGKQVCQPHGTFFSSVLICFLHQEVQGMSPVPHLRVRLVEEKLLPHSGHFRERWDLLARLTQSLKPDGWFGSAEVFLERGNISLCLSCRNQVPTRGPPDSSPSVILQPGTVSHVRSHGQPPCMIGVTESTLPSGTGRRLMTAIGGVLPTTSTTSPPVDGNLLS